MTGNKTLDFLISLLFWAAMLWAAWDWWKKKCEKNRRAKERAEAIASGNPVPAEPYANWFEEWMDKTLGPWLERKLGPWRAEKFGGEQVFADTLGEWPVVRHVAPGVLLMKAPYIGPRRVQDFSGLKPPVLTGMAFGALYFFAYRSIATPGALWQNSITVAVIFMFACIPFWKLAQKTRLVIRFDQGEISWRGPDRKKQLVPPEEPRSLQVLVPHRWANEERTKHENWMRSHPGQSGPKPLFQTSSELVMHTGPGGMNWRTVAEFCNDGSGELAHRLQMAIDFVTDRAAEELRARTKQAADTGPL